MDHVGSPFSTIDRKRRGDCFKHRLPLVIMTCIAFDVKGPEEFVGHCSAVGTVVCLIKMRNLLSNVKERRPAPKLLVARAFRDPQRQLADFSSKGRRCVQPCFKDNAVEIHGQRGDDVSSRM